MNDIEQHTKKPEPVAQSAQVQAKEKPFVFVMQGWMLLLIMAIAFFLLSFMLLSMSSTASGIQKEIHALHARIQQSEEIAESLEVQIASAEAPERVHSIAVNRLEMHLPTQEEVIIIPHIEIPERPVQTDSSQREEEGMFDFLLELVGM